jgi:hypothetical protein
VFGKMFVDNFEPVAKDTNNQMLCEFGKMLLEDAAREMLAMSERAEELERNESERIRRAYTPGPSESPFR